MARCQTGVSTTVLFLQGTVLPVIRLVDPGTNQAFKDQKYRYQSVAPSSTLSLPVLVLHLLVPIASVSWPSVWSMLGFHRFSGEATDFAMMYRT